jgi:hypothetical protein
MNNNNSDIAAMEVDEEEHDDPFLQFVDYAISVLTPSIENNDDEEENDRPGWSWVMGRVIKTCKAYSSGVTPAILLSELSQVT